MTVEGPTEPNEAKQYNFNIHFVNKLCFAADEYSILEVSGRLSIVNRLGAGSFDLYCRAMFESACIKNTSDFSYIGGNEILLFMHEIF